MQLQHSIRQIDTAALQHNFVEIKKLAPHSNILAMVKANAYGHGLIKTAKALENYANGFGVACLSEAKKLRDANIRQKILLLRGIYNQEELSLARDLELDLVVHCQAQVDLLMSHKKNKILTVWLKVNTGMNRLGFNPADISHVYTCLQTKNIILMTHFAAADELDNTLTNDQIKCIEAIKNNLDINIQLSLANSAGILGWNNSHHEWVRPGLMLYGVSPFKNTTGLDYHLKPVMTWTSEIIALHEKKAGDKIGYNQLYTCPKNMRVGVVGVGYGDGYPRYARTGTPILVNGIQTEVIGRVSMDTLMVNVDNVPDVKLGDTVTLWGNHLPIENLGSAYDLLCHSQER